jgi:AraC family transcriptional regulator of adaptative response / DNA-3-methyladenine glycosylase II
MLEESCADELSIGMTAARLGYSERHLRRLFESAYHVAPIQYLQTCRLLLAKNLLAGTRLTITQVALASGFASARRLNDAFQKRYSMPPSRFRRGASENSEKRSAVTVELGYRPPYRWHEMLDFLEERAMPRVELVRRGEYLRAVQIGSASGNIKASNNPKRNTLSVTFSESLLPVLPQVLARVRSLFDLYCDPAAVFGVLQPMNGLMPGACALGTRLPGCFDSFELSVCAILGQQSAIKPAQALAGRVAEKLGTPLCGHAPGLTHAFPAAKTVASLGEGALARLGVGRTQSRAILALAEALESGGITLDIPADPAEEARKLAALPGVGEWAAQYIAMRAMGWTDAFLHTDRGIKKALGSRNSKEALLAAEPWRPWRAYATVNLWNSLKREAK